MANLRGVEVVHVPARAAQGGGRITPGSPPFQRAFLGPVVGPLAAPLGEVLGGVLGGVAAGAIVEGLRDDRTEAEPAQGACVQNLHVSCCSRRRPCDCGDWDGDEAEGACSCEESWLD